ncbi:Vomeronasal 2, receptor 53 [Apodemus speciosus]|uniref:Vomeronasal 2, receptor 53 n=1 Tax=Apodemus speciosus TaxID=105296 RepID=A0ABQ0EXG0_APOSI
MVSCLISLPPQLACRLQVVSKWGYRVAQSFVFAIEEINRSAHLLPNLTLGFSIRNSGDSVHGALYETMGFLTGQEEPIPNYTCQHGSPQAALVGDTRSSLSVSMARLLGLYKFPQCSFSGVSMLSLMVGYKHLHLYWSGTGRASQGTAISGSHRSPCIWETGEEGSPEEVSDFLELELQAVVSYLMCVLGIELGSSTRTRVSYSSSLPSLSDKIQFPSFIRTLSSDLTSSRAVTQLIIHFQWSWVVILAHDDDFGQQASSLATQQLSPAGVCIEFCLHVPSHHSLGKIEETVQKMQKCSARVVLVFLSNANFQLILYGLLAVPVSGQVWVSKDTLHMALALTIPGISKVLQGTFGLLYRSSRAIGFPEFLAHLRPSQTPEDMFIKTFWEFTFDCTWPYQNSTVTEGAQVCSGNESLKNKQHPFPEVSKIDAAYTAVYSIAHALHHMITCEHRDGKGTDSPDFHPWQVRGMCGVDDSAMVGEQGMVLTKMLHVLRKVHFKTPDGNKVMFDANGDLVTKFDIFQGQKTPNGIFHLVHVGLIDPQASSGNKMMVQLKQALQKCPPLSAVKAAFQGSAKCPDWEPPTAVLFAAHALRDSLQTKEDMKRCLLCPKEQYSSHTRDHCLPRTEIFLAFEEPLGFILALVALLLAGLAVLALGVFLKHQDTPVVKANNRTLSYFLLISLSLCALCALLFLGRPTVITCLLRQTTFAVVFTVAVSSVLAKTLTVVLAFRVTRPGRRIQVCLNPGASTSVVLIASSIQAVLCGVWLATSPPFPDRDMVSEPQHIVIQCQEGSGAAFFCVLGYLGFLVWTAFLPLYHSARGKSTVAVEIFSILASTAGLLGGIFIPKCYIILLKPEKNTPAWLRPGHHV